NLNFAVPSNYVSGLLTIADKEHPIRSWDESHGDAFNEHKETSTALNGTWKSTCGGLFHIVETETAIRVINLAYLQFTYDLKREGDVIFGTVYGGHAEWFLLKL